MLSVCAVNQLADLEGCQEHDSDLLQPAKNNMANALIVTWEQGWYGNSPSSNIQPFLM
jgi:hypothetical protein